MKAKTPNMEMLERNYPFTTLQASGIAVGLPWGESGNSEVGHMNLGAGFIRYQSLPRITMDIQNGGFFKNEVLLRAIEHAKKKNSALHLMGLVSSGNVHSSMDHLFALLRLCKQRKIKDVFIHMFTDGRDTPPKSALTFLKELKKEMKKNKVGKIASVAGRYYAMDRNNNWDRVEKAYMAMVGKSKRTFKKPEHAIKAGYKEDKTDEFIPPATILEKGEPAGPLKDSDSAIFFDFRPDRARQITKAFVLPTFMKFDRERIRDLFFVTMTKYDESLPVKIAYEDVEIREPLSKVISDNGLRQLHIAETEKYAHVTYFFNGGEENPEKGEKHILIPSPPVSDYSETPEMSARQIGDRVVRELSKGKYEFILVNIANPDMIGHSGNFEAAVEAVEVTDQVLRQMIDAILGVGGSVLVTADHGNVEQMVNPKTHEGETEHTTNPVPLCIVDNKYKCKNSEEEIIKAKANPTGVLADVAPTVLSLLGIKKPDEMTGVDMVKSLGLKKSK